ncbi:hypothetical protein ABI59_15555 [Acidobacteria bacterium Mor1]|nr:hypothetical protein ABI59_15555 [Acidobacteria bacterium Mor1]
MGGWRRSFSIVPIRPGVFPGVLLIVALWVVPAAADTLILDAFDYADDTAARAAWLNRGISPKVTMADSGPWGTERVMTLPCNFSALPDRGYWDRLDTFDLSAYSMFALELYVPDPAAVSQFTLYFRSGGGWYSQSWPITQAGWQTLTFTVTDFSESGTPGGWDQIDTIRLSPWRESEEDTEIAVRELRAFQPDVFVLHDKLTTESALADRSADLVQFMLSEYDISLGVFDNSALDNGYLQYSKFLILPYNDVLTDPQLTTIEQFVGNGGKLMAFYRLPTRIGNLLGLTATGSDVGDYKSYTFDDATIPHLPGQVRQNSWTLTEVAALPILNARMIAEWEDSAGVKTGKGAWFASDNGSYKSHIIHLSDRVQKQRMLLSLIGHDLPEIWPTTAARAIERIGQIAEYANYAEAVADIQGRAPSTPRQAEIDAALLDAENTRNQALAEQGAGQHADATFTAMDAREHLQQAYYLSQSAALPEFRAVWEHAGSGPYPGDWARAIDQLADNGYNAVYPNSLRAGLAHYDSDLLPHSSLFNTHGDQITAVVDAARARGIEVHVWKLNWNLGRAPQDFIDQMRAEGRTQVSATGKHIDWLCPSHPDNLALEHDSMMEVVQNYDVDGIHFDYIRYPGPDYCYDDGCHARFQAETGNTVTDWPADVRSGGPLESAFLDWRRAQITELVEAVHTSAKAHNPDIEISAAVFGDYDQAYGNVGQDWVDWIDRGIVDHLHPMSTTPDYDRFRELVNEQLALSAGRVPTYPGIGITNDATRMTPDMAVAQVLITRELGTGGYIMFNFDQDVGEIFLPALGLGTTLPGGVGETPDGLQVPGNMLTLAKAGAGQLELSWGDTCHTSALATDYAIYRGTLATSGGWNDDHQPVSCSTGGATMEIIPDAPGDHYFLVVATDTNQEGGYGFDSGGTPRAVSSRPCHPQTALACP